MENWRTNIIYWDQASVLVQLGLIGAASPGGRHRDRRPKSRGRIRLTGPVSVVDANLKVYGIENLCIADGSIMPRGTTGNTIAPCVIIGERAGEILRADHKL
jgi:GMC oxidoreductase